VRDKSYRCRWDTQRQGYDFIRRLFNSNNFGNYGYMAMTLTLDRSGLNKNGLLGLGGGMRSTECHSSYTPR